MIRSKRPHARWAIRKLERTIHQDELNQILRNMGTKTGVEAADSALHDLEVSTTLIGTENIPAEGRFIFVSNHPLGGQDGVALGAIIGKHYDSKFRYLVNDLLMYLPGLAPLCIPINKTGHQSRNFPAIVKAGFESQYHMLMYPAGICSRRQKDGTIRDIP
jgi:putative hemolysin